MRAARFWRMVWSGCLVLLMVSRVSANPPPVDGDAPAAQDVAGGPASGGSGLPGAASDEAPGASAPSVATPGLEPNMAPPVGLVPLPQATFVMVPVEASLLPGQESTFRFLLINTLGQPVAGVPISVNVDRGRVARFEEERPGIFAVVYQAPGDPEGGVATLQLRTLSQERVISQSFPIEVRRIYRSELKLSLSSSRLLLGHEREVKLVVEGRAADGRPLRSEDLELVTNVGHVERLTTVEPGRIEGVFVPGERSSPQVAIIAAFVGEGSSQQVQWGTVQLIGTPEVPVSTEPGSTVWAEVGSSIFGPFSVGASGQVRIPVQVPPGVRKMVIRVRDSAGNTSRSSQDLSIPRFPRAVMRIDRPAVRVDLQEPLTLTLILIEEDGTPAALPGSPMQVTGGRLGGFVENAPGTFTATYTPPERPGRQQLTLATPLAEGGVERYEVQVDVREGVPAKLELRVSPSTLRTDDPPAEVALRVTDQAGNPGTGVRLKGTVALGTLEPFRTVGPGEYVSLYRPPATLEAGSRNAAGQVSVPLQVTLQRLPGEGPPASVALVSRETVVQAGGIPVPIYARVHDRWGAPVEHVRVHAEVESGDGSVSPVQETDGDGRAGFRYVPGAHAGPVVLACTVDGQSGLRSRLLLIQAAAPQPAIALYSTEEVMRVTGIADLHTESEVLVRAGRVKEIQISALPNVVYADARQTSRIRVRLVDASGNFVVDPTLRLQASAGTLSPVRLELDGFYTAQYSPPETAGAVGRATITVTNPQREYVGSTELQLIRQDGPYVGSVRVGLLTNLGAVVSPLLSVETQAKLPWPLPALYAGASLGYYFYVPRADATLRYNLFPMHLFGAYRHQIGRFTPYVGLGPSLTLVLLRQDKLPSLPRHAVGLFPGLAGMLGLEVGFGPGGLAAEVGVSVVQGQYLLGRSFKVESNLGGLSIQLGYAAHF